MQLLLQHRHGLALSRPPRKRGKHIIVDVCSSHAHATILMLWTHLMVIWSGKS